ncbi:MAG: transporter [Glaciihabitans sp.]|nr:transporter [Glaciihabitans sp.]
MIGAGIFFVWAPASAAAGTGLLFGLLIAAVVATLNALSTAQLAIAYPVSGGAYAYGRANVGPWTGFAAGWLFLAGKSASAGAIALIAGSYVMQEHTKLVAVLIVVVLAGVNASGIRNTALIASVVVCIVLAGLAAVLVDSLATSSLHPVPLNGGAGWYGVLQSAGLLFFTFAGYARMATLGEEVRNPRRTLPRAILIALGATLVIYAIVGVVCVSVLGTATLAHSAAPVADLVTGPMDTIVRIIATIACLGSLAAVLAGLSRTGLAMARERDLPGPLSRISPRTNAPVVAELVLAAVVIVGILVLDPAKLIGFSSCSVLAYYAIAHVSALRQAAVDRWLPRPIQVIGLFGCGALALTLPWQSILAAVAVILVGFALRAVGQRARSDRSL